MTPRERARQRIDGAYEVKVAIKPAARKRPIPKWRPNLKAMPGGKRTS